MMGEGSRGASRDTQFRSHFIVCLDLLVMNLLLIPGSRFSSSRRIIIDLAERSSPPFSRLLPKDF